MDDKFMAAMEILFPIEGGWSDHKADRGGKTNLGITEGTFQRAIQAGIVEDKPLRDLTTDEAAEIYWHLYWNPGRCPDIPSTKLAICHFDGCVNHGVGGAGRILQKTLNQITDPPGLVIDGAVGPKTLKSVRQALFDNSEEAVVLSLIANRADYYRAIVNNNHTQEVFLKGWLNRLHHLRKGIGLA